MELERTELKGLLNYRYHQTLPHIPDWDNQTHNYFAVCGFPIIQYNSLFTLRRQPFSTQPLRTANEVGL